MLELVEYDSVVSCVTALPISFNFRVVARLSSENTQAALDVQQTANMASGPDQASNHQQMQAGNGRGGRGGGRRREMLFCQLYRTPGHTAA